MAEMPSIRLDVVTTTSMPNEPELEEFFNPGLPENLKKVSIKFYDIAQWMFETLPASSQRAQGLWDLLRAKDCAVRAVLAEERDLKRRGSDLDEKHLTPEEKAAVEKRRNDSST